MTAARPEKCSGNRRGTLPRGGDRNPTRTGISRRGLAVLAVVALAVAGSVGAAAVRGCAPDPAHVPARGWVESDGLRYEFDALTGREALFDAAADADGERNLVRERPDDARRMRALLVRKLRVPSLDAMRDAHSATADELRRLGYL